MTHRRPNRRARPHRRRWPLRYALARIARRPARLLCLHRLHRARRHGHRRRRLGRRQPRRRTGARGPHAARRRRRLLADPARGQAARTRVPARRAAKSRSPPRLRAMARAGDGRLALVELKAVDGAYPMLGELDARAETAAAATCLAERDGAFGAAADSDPAGAARPQARRPRHASATRAFRSAASSTPSPTSSPAASALARAS